MGRVYAISDLHGRLDIWNEMKKILKDDDVLYCLGDCIDRTYGGIAILKDLLEKHNTFIIKGNHEVLMIDNFESILDNPKELNVGSNNLWMINGGMITYFEIEDTMKTIREARDFINIISKLPSTLKYVNKQGDTIILDHCGFTPGVPFHKYWDRSHFFDDFPENIKGLDFPDIIVHGHTSVQSLKDRLSFSKQYSKLNIYKDDKKPMVITYANGHKIDIDMGSAFSNRGVMLDLDTFEEIYIDVAAPVEYY